MEGRLVVEDDEGVDLGGVLNAEESGLACSHVHTLHDTRGLRSQQALRSAWHWLSLDGLIDVDGGEG